MKQAYLYLDTSDHLVVGLLTRTFDWIDFHEISGAKNSGKIHVHIHELLSRHGIEPLGLVGIIQNAGPGSYTGMRVSEGLAQLFEWKDIKIFSFYHFEVPRILGVAKGSWVAKAFKGEFFHYSWEGKEDQKELLSLDLLKEKLIVDFTATHFVSSLQKDFLPEELMNFKETGDMIKNRSKDLFSYVVARSERFGPYYFRSVDQEFKPSI